jgi:prevent-host-death family protein
MIVWQSDLSRQARRVTSLTATEASRSFSDLLNRVAAGEEIEITRAGAPVALIGPPRPRTFLPADEFRSLIASLDLDDDFARDLEAIRTEPDDQRDPWES